MAFNSIRHIDSYEAELVSSIICIRTRMGTRIGNKNARQSRHLYLHKSLQRRVQNLFKYLECFRVLNTPLHLNLCSLKTCSLFSMNLIRLYIISEIWSIYHVQNWQYCIFVKVRFDNSAMCFHDAWTYC